MELLRRLLQLDTRFSKKMRIAEQTPGLKAVCSVLAHSGDSWFWLAGLALIIAAAPAAWKLPAGIFLGAILITAVVTMTAKFTIRRQRPAGDWGDMYRSVDPHSFPSGHASRAFMLAVLSLGILPPWLSVILIIWAPLVAAARVALGVHYFSDIAAGAILGIILGLGFIQIIPFIQI